MHKCMLRLAAVLVLLSFMLLASHASEDDPDAVLPLRDDVWLMGYLGGDSQQDAITAETSWLVGGDAIEQQAINDVPFNPFNSFELPQPEANSLLTAGTKVPKTEIRIAKKADKSEVPEYSKAIMRTIKHQENLFGLHEEKQEAKADAKEAVKKEKREEKQDKKELKKAGKKEKKKEKKMEAQAENQEDEEKTVIKDGKELEEGEQTTAKKVEKEVKKEEKKEAKKIGQKAKEAQEAATKSQSAPTSHDAPAHTSTSAPAYTSTSAPAYTSTSASRAPRAPTYTSAGHPFPAYTSSSAFPGHAPGYSERS